MKRTLRIIFATIFFIGITLLFLDITGVLHTWFGWMAKIQFLPAILALNFAIVAALIVLTLLFGRIYCSVICPLGIFQDICNHFGSKGKKRKARFSFKKENKWLRYGVLAVFVILMVAGLNSIAILIAPYSAYGRIASELFAPIYGGVNNLFAHFSELWDNYDFYSTDVYIKSISAFVVAVVTFVLIAVLSFRRGRAWCNNICPVGTVLGLFSRFAAFKPVINTEKCNGCTLCARKCKASCINPAEHKIDYSRCVMCMDCFSNCNQNAYELKFMWGKKTKKDTVQSQPEDNSRRQFLATAGALTVAATLDAQSKKVQGGYAEILDKKAPERATSIKPAGSLSVKNFSNHCTGCQLCVQNCPNQVLRPSIKLDTFLQPEMSYEKGYCRPECTACSDVCPAGAIRPISKEEKSSTRIGHAVWIKDNCVVVTKGDSCGNCARHCSSEAIVMVPFKDEAGVPVQGKRGALMIPAVNEEKCIGCGACENLCPARPFSAIYVEGHLVHSTK